MGAVQALAAYADGTSEIAAVDMITGPGNAYVAEAKRLLFGVVGIDLPAGVTEILVVADASADSDLVACDLLGQAEHGPTSPAHVVTDSPALADAVLESLMTQLRNLPTRAVAEEAWRRRGAIAIVADREQMAATLRNSPPSTWRSCARTQAGSKTGCAITARSSWVKRRRSRTRTRPSAVGRQ